MQRRGFLVPLFAAALLHAMFLYCSRVRVRIAIPRNSKPIDSDLPWVRTRTVLCFALLTLYQPRDTASRSSQKPVRATKAAQQLADKSCNVLFASGYGIKNLRENWDVAVGFRSTTQRGTQVVSVSFVGFDSFEIRKRYFWTRRAKPTTNEPFPSAVY